MSPLSDLFRNPLVVALTALQFLSGACQIISQLNEPPSLEDQLEQLVVAHIAEGGSASGSNSVKSGSGAPVAGSAPGVGKEIAAPSVPSPTAASSMLLNNNGNNQVAKLNPDGSVASSFSVDQNFSNLNISPDGAQIAGNFGPIVTVYNQSGIPTLSTNLTTASGPVATKSGLTPRDINPAPVPGGMSIMPDNSGAYITDTANSLFYWINFTDKSATAYTNPVTPTGSGKPAILPNASQLWIPNPKANSITVFDTFTNTLVTTITGIPNPVQVAFLGDGTRAAVLSSPASGTGAVYAVDARTYAVIGSAGVGLNPRSLSVSPYQTRVWTANSGSGTISQVDIGGIKPVVLQTASTGPNPLGVAARSSFSY